MVRNSQITRRGLLAGLSASLAGVLVAPRAAASVAQAVSLRRLVHASRHALVGTPVDMFCQWETFGRRRRIVTYSLVRVDQPIDGRSTDEPEMVVRTLGGRVGDIGQVVNGEALLRVESRCVLFLQDIVEGLYSVTAMAQGHFPLRPDGDGVQRLLRSPRVPELLPARDAAVRLLDGRSVREAEELVSKELHGDGE